MTGLLLPGVRPSELAVLTSGVSEVLTSAQYREVLRSWPTGVLDSPYREINPLPRPPLLEGADDGAVFARLGYRVETVDAPDADPAANGATWHSRRLVQVNRTRSPLQRAKTLAHELAHVVLHALGQGATLPGRVRELRAETFAWVVMRRLGIDSGSFSFAFIAKYGAVRQGAVLQPDRAIAGALRDVSLLVYWAISQMPAAEAA